MPDTLGTQLYRSRTQLALLGSQRVTQEEMAQHLSDKLTEMLGRPTIISRRTYSKYEGDKISPPHEREIRKILGLAAGRTAREG